MKTTEKPQVIKIDAKGKILGRLATEISVLLRDKNEPTFSYNTVANVKIVVFNVRDILVTGDKIKQKNITVIRVGLVISKQQPTKNCSRKILLKYYYLQ